jgi:hypothetical protein
MQHAVQWVWRHGLLKILAQGVGLGYVTPLRFEFKYYHHLY